MNTKWKAVVVDELWAWHGEGGTQSRLEIHPEAPLDPYVTTEAEKKMLHDLAAEINGLKAAREDKPKEGERWLMEFPGAHGRRACVFISTPRSAR